MQLSNLNEQSRARIEHSDKILEVGAKPLKSSKERVVQDTLIQCESSVQVTEGDAEVTL